MPEQTIEELKKELLLFKQDPQKRGYFSLVRIVNQQIDFLNGFSIKEKIGGKPSEDGTFARTKDMWENLPKMISSLLDLRAVLKINSDDEKEDARKPTTPESMAQELGDNKTQEA
jgi:hypothetical protein